MEVKEILLSGCEQQENFTCKLNSSVLGKIVKVIWGERVKLVRRGPRNDQRTLYLNLRPKLPQESFEKFRDSSIGVYCDH